jgi:hypothetical protein
MQNEYQNQPSDQAEGAVPPQRPEDKWSEFERDLETLAISSQNFGHIRQFWVSTSSKPFRRNIGR